MKRSLVMAICVFAFITFPKTLLSAPLAMAASWIWMTKEPNWKEDS